MILPLIGIPTSEEPAVRILRLRRFIMNNHSSDIHNSQYDSDTRIPCPIGILFDLDGVIVDSEREYTKIWNLINDEFPTGVADFAEKIKGTTLDKILSEYYPDKDLRKEVEKKLYEEEAKMRYSYSEGAEDLLITLRQNHIPTALVTSSNKMKMAHLYRDIPNLKKYFNIIVTGDMVSRSKPDPEGYLLAAMQMGVNPRNCIVIEDALQGAKAGRTAGCKVLGMAGTFLGQVLQPYCDKVIDTLKDLTFKDIENIFVEAESEVAEKF